MLPQAFVRLMLLENMTLRRTGLKIYEFLYNSDTFYTCRCVCNYKFYLKVKFQCNY